MAQHAIKAEARNTLARVLFIHRLGKICERTYEKQAAPRLSLNLLVTANILWNNRYLKQAVVGLRKTENVPDRLLVHLSPLGWEHLDLPDNYVWGASEPLLLLDGAIRKRQHSKFRARNEITF